MPDYTYSKGEIFQRDIQQVEKPPIAQNKLSSPTIEKMSIIIELTYEMKKNLLLQYKLLYLFLLN